MFSVAITLKNANELFFARDGAQIYASALTPSEMAGIDEAIADLPSNKAGVRIHELAALRPFMELSSTIGRIAASVQGPDSRPVRAILFDKTIQTNWSLGWHQDRTIAVRRRLDVDGYGPWTVKDGHIHVEPPFEILSAMVTIRAHLDDVPMTNAPLLISPGSHVLGRIATTELGNVIQRCGVFACLANAGDIWLYATPILHASDAATEPRSRRVLQVDFSAALLPGGLGWSGV